MNATLANSQRSHPLSDMAVRSHRHRSAGSASFEILSLTPWPRISRYQATTARLTADKCQAAYFVELLAQQLRRIDYRIDKCRRGIAVASRDGDVEDVHAFRRLMQAEEQERAAVEGLLEMLQRRFGLPVARNAP